MTVDQEKPAVVAQAIVPRSGVSIVSFGGGINSTALLVLMQRRQYPIDAVLFADTGGEKPATYEHIATMNEWLTKHNLPTITTCAEAVTLEDDCLDRETLPGKAFGFGSCSERFKIRPMQRKAKELFGKDATICWNIGIHAGEAHRGVFPRENLWVRRLLVEAGWAQHECVKAIREEGLPIPVKSACFFCPAMRKAEVIQLSKDAPALFRRAVDMEQAALASGQLETVKGLGRRWSWKALVAADERQQRLFEDDQSPICGVCMDG